MSIVRQTFYEYQVSFLYPSYYVQTRPINYKNDCRMQKRIAAT